MAIWAFFHNRKNLDLKKNLSLQLKKILSKYVDEYLIINLGLKNEICIQNIIWNKTAKYNTLIVEPKGKYKCKPVIRDMNAKHTIEQLRHRHYITISKTLREGTELRSYYYNHSFWRSYLFLTKPVHYYWSSSTYANCTRARVRASDLRCSIK